MFFGESVGGVSVNFYFFLILLKGFFYWVISESGSDLFLFVFYVELGVIEVLMRFVKELSCVKEKNYMLVCFCLKLV